ncbi:hypothetical protein CDD83_1537 [Cordyceps sp. RAO-2017]|nr:hypothetical protein CDD83_1537 [Cordyceps sp. RAO-2017]
MPGRQAHGRSLLTNPKSKPTSKKSKARSQKIALDAFGIAQEKFATKEKRTPRARELDAESERKHGREEEDDDDEEGEDGDGAPRRKKVKGPSRPTTHDDDAEYGSDSEGNEWRLGGLAEGHEDSEIESDDAFGDSDNETFQGYSLRGSKSKKTAADDSEDDSNDDEGETLGADAIDLATALDQFEEDSDEEPPPEADGETGSEKSYDEDSDDSGDSEDDDQDEGDEEEADPDQLKALQGLVSDYGGGRDDGAAAQSSSRPKIGLGDLGLAGLDDPFLKKSVKLMKKEEKEKRPGATKRLDAPLPRRQQGRLDRAAAYEKTNETLDRWTETVKQNRRAEHLVFPLPQNSATAGLDTTEIQPLTTKSAGNELESTIMSIMEQSGLPLQKQSKPKPREFDEDGNPLSRAEALQRKRVERELNAREAKRAKRIKKIKSKAYHRVHRKQRERDEMAAKEAMEEAGEVDSEAEREAQDRRRALERVGQRHKESKWAKIGAKTKRAVWDDDFRAGLTEMARKDEELRRRKEGKGGVDDSDSDTSSSSGDEDEKLRRQLDELEAEEDDDDAPHSKLMGLKFMQKAAAAKKQADDELIRQIRKELDGGDDAASDEEETSEVGRRSFGAAAASTSKPALDTTNRTSARERAQLQRDSGAASARDGGSRSAADSGSTTTTMVTPVETAGSTVGAWSRGESRRAKKKASSAGARTEELDLRSHALVAAPKQQQQPAEGGGADGEGDSGSEAEQHLPLAIRDQELVARAFAGEDVVGDFAREKAAAEAADDDQVIDRTLPGWGSWVGEGVSGRERRRHQGRFLTRVAGVKKKDRQDARLERVIISEKRVKKNARFLAPQLPHPFESRQQYERSLRLPVGPEWVTKESFQGATRPRVLLKGGVVAPISKPMA